MPGVEQSIEVAVPPDKLRAVIVDYERYPEFLPEMEAVKVLSRTGNQALVEYQLNLIKRISYTLRLTETPTSVTWTLERSGLMKHNVGGWTLEALPNGHTRATYRLDVQIHGLVPMGIVDRLTGRTLPATLEAFKKRAEGRA